MNKAAIAGIGTILIIFSFLIVYAQEERAPVFPIQVYGNITPAIPDNHVIYFRIGSLEYASSNIISSKYGYAPLVFIPSDDLGTLETEGYNATADAADIVDIYIDSVKVKTVSNLTSPEQINIELTTSQYDQIVGTTPEPQTSTPVVVTKKGGGGGGGCFYRWNCSDFGACLSNGNQTQFCINKGTCRPKNKTISQECTYIAPRQIVEKVPEEAVKEEPAQEIPTPEKNLAWLWYTIIIIVVAGGLGFVIYEKKRSHKALKAEMKQPKLEDKSTENLKNYIKNTMDMGYTREQVKKELLLEGWAPKILNDVFAKVK